MRIPALKFRIAGEYNETLVAILRQNSRLPDTLMGDLNAQLAACTVEDCHGSPTLRESRQHTVPTGAPPEE